MAEHPPTDDLPPRSPDPGEVRREMRDFLRVHEQRRRQLPRALLLGVVAGLLAVAFQWSLHSADQLRGALIAWARTLGSPGIVVPMLYGAVGVTVAMFLVRRFEPDAAGSGIPHVRAVLSHLRTIRWPRILLVKFLGGVAGIGAGLALGREGPTIQMGGAVGQMVSGWFRCTPRERRTLIAAGSGAGLSAAFNAPLAGLVFVLEELQRDFAPAVFTVTLIASVTADVMTRFLYGHLPVFHVGTHPIPTLETLPLFFLLGGAAGLVGVVFNRALVFALDTFRRVAHWPVWVTGGLVGAGIGFVGWFVPGALAGGQRLVEATLAGQLALGSLAGFFVLRFALTTVSYGTGAPGGIFAPMLVLGAALGMMAGKLSQWGFPASITHPETFAVVGMAALFTAIVRAPLTGIVLMVEMTGDYSLVLPLLVAALTAAGLADYLGDKPIYEVLLRRDVQRWQEKATLGDTFLLDLTIAPGAPFEGRLVRELGLPPGCIVIGIQRGVSVEVPTADFRLEAGDRLTCVVGRQAADAVAVLHHGVGAGG